MRKAKENNRIESEKMDMKLEDSTKMSVWQKAFKLDIKI
jgi:hypothetical protein